MRKVLVLAVLVASQTAFGSSFTFSDAPVSIGGNATTEYYVEWVNGERTDNATLDVHVGITVDLTQRLMFSFGVKNADDNESKTLIDYSFLRFEDTGNVLSAGYIPVKIGEGLVVNDSLTGMTFEKQFSWGSGWLGVLEAPSTSHTFLFSDFKFKLPVGGELEVSDYDEDVPGKGNVNTGYVAVRPFFRADTGYLSASSFFAANKDGKAYGAGLKVKSAVDPEDFTAGSIVFEGKYHKFTDDFTFPFSDYDGYGEIIDDDTVFSIASPEVAEASVSYERMGWKFTAQYVQLENDTTSTKEAGVQMHRLLSFDTANLDLYFKLGKAEGDLVDTALLPSWKVLTGVKVEF